MNGTGTLKRLEPYLRSDKTLYVNGATGNDANNGSQSKPYKTIQKAVDAIPPVLCGYTATISVAAGTYAENVVVSGKTGGKVSLATTGGTVTVNSIYISDGVFFESVYSNLSVVQAGYDIGINAKDQSVAYFRYGTVAINGKSLGLGAAHAGRILMLSDIAINNCGYAAYSGIGGEIAVAGGSLSGSGNTIGFAAESLIRLQSVGTLAASTMYHTVVGGRIYAGGQASVPSY
jgi:hypothetical protein